MRSKKAFMGIGTLIIFISVILTATVASGVILRTSGILQQKSFSTASEVRQGITRIMQVISVFGWNENNTITKLNIMLNYLTSADEIWPEMISINLEPQNILYLLDYHNNMTFYNKKQQVKFCNAKTLELDLNADRISDKIAIENSTLYYYLNDSERILITKWSGSLNISKVIGKALGEIKVIGNAIDNCTTNVNITITPYNIIGHFILEQFDNSSIIHPGENLKVLMKVPNLMENKEYGLRFIVKRAIATQVNFEIPDLYKEYMQLY